MQSSKKVEKLKARIKKMNDEISLIEKESKSKGLAKSVANYTYSKVSGTYQVFVLKNDLFDKKNKGMYLGTFKTEVESKAAVKAANKLAYLIRITGKKSKKQSKAPIESKSKELFLPNMETE